MESKQPNYPIKWEVKSHSSQIADTGDYDGYWEITNGRDSLITKDDYDDIDKDLQELADLLNNTYPNFTVDRGNEAALDAENKWLRQELEELRNAPAGPRWVRAVDRLPGWNQPVHWRLGEGYTQTRGIALSEFQPGSYIEKWQWLDDTPEQQSDGVAFSKWILDNGFQRTTSHDGITWMWHDYTGKYGQCNYTAEELYDTFKNLVRGKEGAV